MILKQTEPIGEELPTAHWLRERETGETGEKTDVENLRYLLQLSLIQDRVLLVQISGTQLIWNKEYLNHKPGTND